MGIPGESKQFKEGSEQPKLSDKGLTVFSMRFCPYAERVRLLLNVKEIPYEVVNIDLKSKPEWFLKLNPLGKVPAILEPGLEPLYESLILTEYLDEKYPGTKQIAPKDAYEKARQKVLIEVVMQKILPAYYAVVQRSEGDVLEKSLADIEHNLTSKFFAGEKLGYVDLMVWPWFERLPALAAARDNVFEFSGKKYPKLFAWTQAMLEDPAVKATTYSKELFVQFLKTVIAGAMTGDVGL